MIESSVVKDVIERVSLSLAEILVQTSQGVFKVGTGFAISSDGMIATCTHVIDGYAEYYAQLWSEAKPLKAKLLIQDARHDLSIIAVDNHPQPLPLGDFQQVELGDDVMWGGFPLEGLVPSFHKGMVTFKGELPLPHTAQPTECFQVDGTINRGNSGGPAIDPRDQRVVGIMSSALGRLDEQLASLTQRQEPGGRLTIMGVDPIATLKTVIAEMDRHLQLGVGYGISVRYLSDLVARL